MSNLVFCLMGPTASGKTNLACELVKLYPFEIISVDSAMIYRDMNIGTAKPSQQELLQAPHYLIDIVNPNEAYSAAQFCADATVLCHKIIQKGAIPLLVGGTMMYFNALQKGLSVLPEADESMRKKLEDEASSLGWNVLYDQLKEIDPDTALRIHANDTQRIQRALEVYRISGIPLSQFFSVKKENLPYRFINIGLFPEQRSWLHERIALRFDIMLKEGFIEEVRRIEQKWQVTINDPAMRCVGYRQVLDYLHKKCDEKTMREKGIAATRQLAKRQLTWLRHWQDIRFIDPQNAHLNQDIIAKIREILDNKTYY